MRRLLRWSFNLAAAASALLFVATCVLWVRSHYGHDDQLNIRLFGDRTLLRSRSSRVTAAKLPSAQVPGAAQVRDWMASTSNAALTWWAMTLAEDDPTIGYFAAQPLTSCVNPNSPAGCFRPVLDALDDPQRFAIAHVILCESTTAAPLPTRGTVFLRPSFGPQGVQGHIYRDLARRQIVGHWDGLWVELPPGGVGWNADPFFAAVYRGPANRYDPAQMPALRDLWFGRMAQPVWSWPYWLFAALSALPSLLWLARRWRSASLSRRRHCLGLCRACGYDLRATPDV